MQQLTRDHAERRAEPRRRPEVAPAGRPAIRRWAVAGGLVLAFQLFVVAKWVLGPNFARVPSGPSEPPLWMKLVLNGWQIASLPVLAFLLWRFLVRPWRRDGRPSTDGLLCLAFLSVSFQDPLSSYFGHWFTYNSYLFNRGSWVHDIPGWMSPGQPGKMLVEPVVFTPAAYVYVCLGLSVLGCWIMRRVRARHPGASTLRLVSICFAVMALASVVIEGVIWMPLGFYTYAGGKASIFADTYHKFPIHEAVFFGAAFTGLACLRYFKNDKGETIAERGLDELRGSPRRSIALRFLGLVAATNLIFFLGYNVGNLWVGAHSNPWPRDLQRRSYLTDYLCGAGTDRACPGSGTVVPFDN